MSGEERGWSSPRSSLVLPQRTPSLLMWLYACLLALCLTGDSASTLNVCGDWTSYKDEKCLNIASKSGLQAQEDAKVVCKTYNDELDEESVPQLLTIRSKDEQQFIQKFLYDDNKIVDSVWLGLAKNETKGLFEWKDRTELAFSNWADQTLEDHDHQCVEMESREGTAVIGLWFRVSCQRKNVVVCERRPNWSFEMLQDTFLNFKTLQEIKLKESQERLATCEQEVKAVKANPGPVGFIYVQFGGQAPPTELWPPAQNWQDVSGTYASSFFRAYGSSSASFGSTQTASSPRLRYVENYQGHVDAYQKITVPENGGWSSYTYTGANGGRDFYLRFQLSTDEVRPKNQAIKIWKRIK